MFSSVDVCPNTLIFQHLMATINHVQTNPDHFFSCGCPWFWYLIWPYKYWPVCSMVILNNQFQKHTFWNKIHPRLKIQKLFKYILLSPKDIQNNFEKKKWNLWLVTLELILFCKRYYLDIKFIWRYFLYRSIYLRN